MRYLTCALLLALAMASPAMSQGNPAVMQQKLQEMSREDKAKEVLRELTQSEYRAKMDIPQVDCIFVQDGKISKGTYRLALKGNPRALKAGAVTKISSVKLMDRGIQIFFATDTCALIGVSSEPIETATMSTKNLLELAKKSIGPLFETVAPAPAKPVTTSEGPEKKS